MFGRELLQRFHGLGNVNVGSEGRPEEEVNSEHTEKEDEDECNQIQYCGRRYGQVMNGVLYIKEITRWSC